jgi:hypothetical protein
MLRQGSHNSRRSGCISGSGGRLITCNVRRRRLITHVGCLGLWSGSHRHRGSSPPTSTLTSSACPCPLPASPQTRSANPRSHCYGSVEEGLYRGAALTLATHLQAGTVCREDCYIHTGGHNQFQSSSSRSDSRHKALKGVKLQRQPNTKGSATNTCGGEQMAHHNGHPTNAPLGGWRASPWYKA